MAIVSEMVSERAALCSLFFILHRWEAGLARMTDLLANSRANTVAKMLDRSIELALADMIAGEESKP
jgi:hypothetical protein